LLEKGGQLRKPDLMSDTGSKPSYWLYIYSMYLYSYSCRRGQLRKRDLMFDTGSKLTYWLYIYFSLCIHIFLKRGGQLRKPDPMSDTGSKPSYWLYINVSPRIFLKRGDRWGTLPLTKAGIFHPYFYIQCMYLYAYSWREGDSWGNLTSCLTQAVSLHTDSTYMYLYVYRYSWRGGASCGNLGLNFHSS
jgi:hypothetical protein